ncbi:50S ribosomal protein L21 [Calycomorphotria hydatis]|uniref:Large ribosomal subunit protein bL21 n=1 Tax=Calycomorphotria hydatis TaxID=2528027 RepID=A0A517TF73_9PLAN|nr:50S ribosomal protein L21 [Calycomorphotria hydatis]QDT67017.1 50S ribosomal protein L21 [Calycomorphotria hydatis]
MFAIIEDGSRQYRVSEGDKLSIDLRNNDGEPLEVGSSITFDKVLLANGGAASVIGRPLIDGATVAAEVIDPTQKGDKVEIQKFRRRKNSKRHTGHRQKYTLVQIGAIDVPGLEVVEAAPAAAAPEAAAESTTAEE